MLQAWARDCLLSIAQVLTVVGIVQLLGVTKISHGEVRFISEPLQIRINQQSPPYIALQDILRSQAEPEASEPSYELNVEQEEAIELKPMLIQRENLSHIQVRPMTVSRADFRDEVDVKDAKAYLDRSWIQKLEPRLRYRLEKASERTQVLAQDWSIPTFRDVLEMKFYEGFNFIEPTPSPVIVRKPDSNPEIPFRSPETVAEKGTSNRGGKVIAPNPVVIKPVNVEEDPVRIVGPVLLTQGLAFSPGQHLEVYREEEGFRVQDGRVNIAEASYEIDIPARYGTLVARLLSKEGRVVGQTSVNLNDYKEVKTAQGLYDGLHLKLAPHREGLSGTIVAAQHGVTESHPIASQLQAQGLEATFVSDEKGEFHLPIVAEESTLMVRTHSATYAQSVSGLISGGENKIQLMPESMLKELEEFLEDQGWTWNASFQPSLLWGQIIDEAGKPISGIQVGSELTEKIYPIYFDAENKPDLKIEKTSSSGYFVFVGLPPGLHPLLLTQNGQYFTHSNVPLAEADLTFAAIEVASQKTKSDLMVFEAFSGEPRAGDFVLQSLSVGVSVGSGGMERLSLPKTTRQSFMMYGGSEEYLPAMYSYIDRQSFIYAPLISRKWWDEKKDLFDTETKDKGHLVGFVEGDSYQVTWTDAQGNQIHPIYFNSEGEVVAEGVSGGGFIFPGLQGSYGTLVVMGVNDPFVHTQVATVDEGLVSVHHFQIGQL